MHHVQDPLVMDIAPGDLKNSHPRAPPPPPPPPPSDEPQEAAPAANPAPPDTAALPYGAERRLLRHAKRIAAEYREAARPLDSAEPGLEACAAAPAADTAAAADTADTAATAALPKKPSQEKPGPRQPRGPPPGKRAADRAADDLADLSLAARYEEPTSVQHLLMPHAFVEAATYGP
jgi:hypothetical protein